MHIAIVIPCLDEAATLTATCRSLGFADPRVSPPPDTTLILVDNGSSDATPEIMDAVQRANPGQVLLESEAERGYVPPRHRGIMVAKDLAASSGWSEDDVLIVQADADTVYLPSYLAQMRLAAQTTPGAMLEGVCRASPQFVAQNPGYHRLIEEADEATSPFLVDEDEEVIIDDKAAAFRLSEYLAWGGHRREYDRDGGEIFAETTRLFLRAKALGARRVRVPEAVAQPSRRKVVADPLLYLATAGFPRSMAWRGQWRERQGQPVSLEDFNREDVGARFKEALWMRQAHTLILFAVLARKVGAVLGSDGHISGPPGALGRLLTLLGDLNAGELIARPGEVLDAALRLIADDPVELELGKWASVTNLERAKSQPP